MSYKESGIEWIGQIPIHWNTLSVSKSYKVTLGKMLQPNLNDEHDVKVHYLKAMNVQDGYLNLDKIEEMYCSINELKGLHLEVGDLVVCEGGEVARSAIIKEELEGFIFQNSVHRVKGSEKGNTRFLHYLLRTLRASGFINILVNKATIAHFTKDKFNSLKIALPSLNEQLIVSDYLDSKCGEIENLIKLKQKLITVLEQQRQSIITEAVTKGLNPNVKMKDSGVEWIGKIPEQWEVIKLKHLGKFVSGYAFPSNAFISNGTKVMKINNIQTMNLNWSDISYVANDWLEKSKQYQVKRGDLVIALTRPIISTGIKASIVDTDEEILLNQRNAYFRSNKLIPSNWLYYLVLNYSFVEEFESLIDRTGQQPNISTNDIENIKIPLPTIEEIKQITKYLNEKSSDIEESKNIILKQIQKLKEYRQSLIYEAVTGKIDVRELELD